MDTVSFFEPMIWTTETSAPMILCGITILVASACEATCAAGNRKFWAVSILVLIANTVHYLLIPLLCVFFFWQAYGGFFVEYLKALHFTVVGCWVVFGSSVFPWLVVFRQPELLRKERIRILLAHFVLTGLTGISVISFSFSWEERYSGLSRDWPISKVRVFYVLADGHSLAERDEVGREQVVYRFKNRPYHLAIRNLDNSILIFSNWDESDGYLVDDVEFDFLDPEREYEFGTSHAYHMNYNLYEPRTFFHFRSFSNTPIIQSTESETFRVSERWFVFRINTGIFVYDAKLDKYSRIGTGLRLLCLRERNFSDKVQDGSGELNSNN